MGPKQPGNLPEVAPSWSIVLVSECHFRWDEWSSPEEESRLTKNVSVNTHSINLLKWTSICCDLKTNHPLVQVFNRIVKTTDNLKRQCMANVNNSIVYIYRCINRSERASYFPSCCCCCCVPYFPS